MPTNASAPQSICPMVRARMAAGLTLEQAARKARVSKDYLKRFESAGGGCSWSLARTLARIYGCPEWAFLKIRQSVEIPTTPERPARRAETKGVASREDRADARASYPPLTTLPLDSREAHP